MQQKVSAVYDATEDVVFTAGSMVYALKNVPEAVREIGGYVQKVQCFFGGKVANAVASSQGKPETPSSSADYTHPNGGGGTTDTIHVGKQEIRFGHGGRHLEGTGLSTAEVNKAIAKEVSRLNIEPQQFYKGRVTVNGITIEYTSFGLKDGVINVGTYYPIK